TNLLRLRALLALGDVELDLLALVEGAVPVRDDRREVHEHVGRAVIGRDEPEALVCVEPLDCSLHHDLSCRSCSPWSSAAAVLPFEKQNARENPAGARHERESDCGAGYTLLRSTGPHRDHLRAANSRRPQFWGRREFARPTYARRRLVVTGCSAGRVGEGGPSERLQVESVNLSQRGPVHGTNAPPPAAHLDSRSSR